MILMHQEKAGEKKAALIDANGQLLALALWREEELNFGDIREALITARAPTPQGWFAKTTAGHPFYLTTPEPLFIGQKIRARIIKEARKGKEAAAVLTQQPPMDAPPPAETLKRYLKEGNTSDEPLLEKQDWETTDWHQAFETALAPSCPIPDGGCLRIGRTDVCWTIDIDSASAASDFKTINRRSVNAIMRQIGLKNMSGHILIDWIGSKSHFFKKQMTETLMPLRMKDSRIVSMGWTPGGLFELIRKRETAALADRLQTPDGRLSALTTAYLILGYLEHTCTPRPLVRAHPEVLKWLHIKKKALTCQPILDKPVDFFEII